MKNFITVLLLSFFTCIPVLAEYKPIPKSLSKQYKAEIEQIIDEEYSQVIKNINNEVKYAKSLRDKILRNGYNLEDAINIGLIQEVVLPAAELDLYGRMLQVTQEKYLGMKYIPIGTDCVDPLDDILTPYFRDNNVNRKKLIKILLYENKQINIVEKYVKDVEKLRPDDNQNLD